MRLAACAFTFAIAIAAPIDETKLVDLTHAFDDKTIHWPAAKPFEWRKDAWGKSAGGYWYTSASFSASEHLGTHLDSPIHFAEGKATTDSIPLRQLVGPAVVIDITRSSAANRDYQLSRADIAAWEKSNGAIPASAIVLVRTGWSARWGDRARYMGTAKDGDVQNLHFPGVSPEAAELLVQRRIDGIGIDTASLDHGPSNDFRTHRVLNAANIYGLENDQPRPAAHGRCDCNRTADEDSERHRRPGAHRRPAALKLPLKTSMAGSRVFVGFIQRSRATLFSYEGIH